MGARGEGLLENDTALDLLGEVSDAAPPERQSLLEAGLRQVADNAGYLGGREVEEALVAALLVLLAAGGTPPPSAGDVTGADTVGRALPRPDPALLELAGRALVRAAELSDNGWLELWDEAGGLEAAQRRVRDLADVLAGLGGAGGPDRKLTPVDGTSDTYGDISCSGVDVTTHDGRTGHDSPEAARREAERQVGEKLGEGYVDAAPVPGTTSPGADDDGVAFFRASVRALVRPGFVSLDEALERLLEQADDDPEIPLGPAEAEAVVRQEWARRVDELADGRPGDDVRVRAAFQALRDLGHVAEMNVGYTSSDAWAELGPQVEASAGQGLVFFHGQDAERLADSPADLYLGFDCVTGDDAEMVAVARAAEKALRAQGLTVVWDGSARTRLEVVDVDWRQPLPGTSTQAPSTPAPSTPAPSTPAPSTPAKTGFLSRFRR